MEEPCGEGLGAAVLAAVLVGERPAGGTCPVATVVISGGGKGDRPVESPEVKALDAWEKDPGRSAKGANNSIGRSDRQESSADTAGEHRGETQDLFKLWLLATRTTSF